MPTAFVNGLLIDGNGALPRRNATVVVDGSRIVEVSEQREFPDNVAVIDLAGKTIMPGLIDAHLHFAGWAQWLVANQHQRLMFLASRTLHAMRLALESGITSARDQGGLDAGFVYAVEQGLVPGPRLQSSVIIVQPTNGVIDNIPGMGGAVSPQGISVQIPGMPRQHADGPDAVRAKVRETLRAGADFIKIASTSITVHDEALWDLQAMTSEEITAAVEEAHNAGVMVTCHAMGIEGTLAAVKAGVDSIEHGTRLNDEIVDEMARRGTWLVPMFWIMNFHSQHDPQATSRARAVKAADDTRRSFALARKAGVRIAMGSDSGEHGLGGSQVELQLMVEAGMSPLESITTSTRRAAECMRWADRIGTVEPGKEADLLVVDGDPLADITVLQRAEQRALVVKAGRPVGGTLLGAGDLASLATVLPRVAVRA